MDGMASVLFGNDAPLMVDGSAAGHLTVSVTRFDMAPDYNDSEVAANALGTNNDRLVTLIGRSLKTDDKRFVIGIHEIEGVWNVHSGSAPSWVSCPDDEDFERVLADYFGCARGEPVALLTNGGRDALHAQHLSTSAQPAAFNYIGLTANTTAESASDTTLTAEITTAGGGLIRAQATYAHTTGTNTSTLSKTFTANGTDTLPVTIGKAGAFNAATSGTLAYEKLLTTTATLNASGDNVAVTWTITAG